MTNTRYTAPEDRLLALAQEITNTLTTCAQQFEFYEQHHRAKGTPDADAKANVNRALADSVRALLARIHGEKP